MAIRKFLLSLRLSPSMAAEYSRNLWEIGYDDMRAIVEDITLQDFTEAAVRRGHSIRILKVNKSKLSSFLSRVNDEYTTRCCYRA